MSTACRPILTRDAIADVTAPIGQITGFPRPRVRSTWPQFQVGKRLTDRRIAYYQALGYYSNSIVALRRLDQQRAAAKKLPKRKRDAAMAVFTVKQIEAMFA